MEHYNNQNWSDARILFKHVENWWLGDPPSCLYQRAMQRTIGESCGESGQTQTHGNLVDGVSNEGIVAEV